MKIVNIIGGLGNQMFQYALSVGLRETYKEKIFVDVTGFSDYRLHNGLELERIFPITLNRAPSIPWHIKSHFVAEWVNRYFDFFIKKNQYEYPDYRYIPSIYSANKKNCYYLGYWHNYKYVESFRKQLLQEFTFKLPLSLQNETVIEAMKNEDSIGIHVRRGDYLKEKQYQGVCDFDYYERAVNLIKDKYIHPVFYIFSNDMRWCHDNLKPLFGDNKIVYVDWNTGQDSYCDMQLMTQCKGLIIANSSFSWWGAFLNNRIDCKIIAPKKWMNTSYNLDIQMPNWIKI